MAKVLAGIRLEEATMQEIKKIAEQKRRTMSDLLRIIIEDFVQQQQKL